MSTPSLSAVSQTPSVENSSRARSRGVWRRSRRCGSRRPSTTNRTSTRCRRSTYRTAFAITSVTAGGKARRCAWCVERRCRRSRRTSMMASARRDRTRVKDALKSAALDVWDGCWSWVVSLLDRWMQSCRVATDSICARSTAHQGRPPMRALRRAVLAIQADAWDGVRQQAHCSGTAAALRWRNWRPSTPRHSCGHEPAIGIVP